jgi:hypothetical protein
MKKIELIVTIHGCSVPDGEDKRLVVVGETLGDQDLQSEFDLKPGNHVSVAFRSYKIDEERSSKDRTSYLGHKWNPATGDMVITPHKDNYKTTVKIRKIS